MHACLVIQTDAPPPRRETFSEAVVDDRNGAAPTMRPRRPVLEGGLRCETRASRVAPPQPFAFSFSQLSRSVTVRLYTGRPAAADASASCTKYPVRSNW
jgi:hypothetical protein